MILGKRLVVVLPAFNAEQTLEKTIREVPRDIVDEIVLVDDCSADGTVTLARRMGLTHVIQHDQNLGYGANQKTCYDTALKLCADIVIMLHPDYQYTPKLIHSMAYLIANNVYPVVLGSRILGNGALRGGMPRYKYFANRILTLLQNILLGQKLSEYHTGYRAYHIDVLNRTNYHNFSNDFLFDNEMLVKIISEEFQIAEITCPTRYFPEASSINFNRSVVYALGVLRISTSFFLRRLGKLLGQN